MSDKEKTLQELEKAIGKVIADEKSDLTKAARSIAEQFYNEAFSAGARDHYENPEIWRFK